MWPFKRKEVPLPTLKTCQRCKHVVNILDMQEVEVINSYPPYYLTSPKSYQYYCPEHRVPYGKTDGYFYFVKQPEWRQVTETGEDSETYSQRIWQKQKDANAEHLKNAVAQADAVEATNIVVKKGKKKVNNE